MQFKRGSIMLVPSPAELLAIQFFVLKNTIFHYTKAKMVPKKVLALVLLKYYDLQTLQNPTIFQFFRRSIKSRLARRKARPVIGPRVGRGRRRAGGRFGSDRKRPGKN